MYTKLHKLKLKFGGGDNAIASQGKCTIFSLSKPSLLNLKSFFSSIFFYFIFHYFLVEVTLH